MTLTDDDTTAIMRLADELAGRHSSVESESFQRESRCYADELPRAVRRALRDFHLTEPSGAFLLSGLPVDDTALGPTPAHWQGRPAASSSLRLDIAFYLVSCLLGEPIGWATQQGGRVMHDIFPIRAHEHEQIGWGSDEVLTWHTEDAFHPMRTDYLSLMCLRNPDHVETTFADIVDVRLDESARAVLAEARFHILPDNSHRTQNQADLGARDAATAALARRSRDRVARALANPAPVAVLFGDPAAPYLRIDPYYMPDGHGEAERRALDAVGAAIDAAMSGVALRPGDICFLDNYRTVHGRKAFRARFDGTDRWLRRLNVTRDLRKSRELRLRPESRVIF